jgi:hypothetical protein
MGVDRSVPCRQFIEQATDLADHHHRQHRRRYHEDDQADGDGNDPPSDRPPDHRSGQFPQVIAKHDGNGGSPAWDRGFRRHTPGSSKPYPSSGIASWVEDLDLNQRLSVSICAEQIDLGVGEDQAPRQQRGQIPHDLHRDLRVGLLAIGTLAYFTMVYLVEYIIGFF